MDCEHKLPFIMSMIFHTRMFHDNFNMWVWKGKELVEYLSIFEYAPCCKKCNIRKGGHNCQDESIWNAKKGNIKFANSDFTSLAKTKEMNNNLDRVYQIEFNKFNTYIETSFPSLKTFITRSNYSTIPNSQQLYKDFCNLVSKSYLSYLSKFIHNIQ